MTHAETRRVAGLLAAVLFACSFCFRPAPAAAEAADGPESLLEANAPEAENLTAACAWTFSTRKDATKRVTDSKFDTSWQQAQKSEGWITVRSPSPDQPIAGVYLCFDIQPESWEIQTGDGETWARAWAGPSPYRHVWVPLNHPAEQIRFWCPAEKKQAKIAEISVFGAGAFPASQAQDWQPAETNADILFLATHADDELIFFGGGIPTYATERGCRVVVAYLADCGNRRTHELLNGLWSMGVRNYPVIGPFQDTAQKTLTKEYQAMGGKTKVKNWVVTLYRQYRPKVVVTHDAKGEYGHAQHRVCAAVAQVAYDAAADPETDPESAAAYGPWQVQKLYLHLAKENRITMNWDVPLQALGGITGLEAAIRAFEYHVSQHEYGMNVTKTGKRYDNRLFGLVRSEVGLDEAGGDFMEHLP